MSAPDDSTRAFRVTYGLCQLATDWTPIPAIAEAVADIAGVRVELAERVVMAWMLTGPLDSRESVGAAGESLWLIRANP